MSQRPAWRTATTACCLCTVLSMTMTMPRSSRANPTLVSATYFSTAYCLQSPLPCARAARGGVQFSVVWLLRALYRKIDCTIDVPDPGYAVVLFALIKNLDKSGCCTRRAELRLAAALSNTRLLHINLRLEIVPIRRQRTIRSGQRGKAKGLVQLCLRSEAQKQTRCQDTEIR